MKLNRLVCPTCGLECLTSAAYTTCDGCQTTFYASQSAHEHPINMTVDTHWFVRDGRVHGWRSDE